MIFCAVNISAKFLTDPLFSHFTNDILYSIIMYTFSLNDLLHQLLMLLSTSLSYQLPWQL